MNAPTLRRAARRRPWAGARRRGLAAALLLLLAGGAARLRRRGARTAPEPRAPARREWSCECGQEYLVSGTDRHRVYWATGAAAADPVLGQECVRCGRRLPVDHETASV